jgi:hypothetical protein
MLPFYFFLASNEENIFKRLSAEVQRLNIPNYHDFINKMITIDYIIGNTDRHLNNFGFIRDAETLKWISCAPIYDSGSSLWYNNINFQIESDRQISCKPFSTSHDEQLKLVTDFSWLDHKNLKNLSSHVETVLSKGAYIFGNDRVAIIVKAFENRIVQLENYINTFEQNIHKKRYKTL